jgi:plastocyanin
MKQLTTYLTVIGMMLMLFAAALTFAQSESQSAKKPYQPNGSQGSLTGTVSLSGTAPGPKQIDMSADPVCYENNPKPLTEFIVVKDGRLANALIYVKAGAALEDLSFETPDANVVLDQRGCRYVPHVLGVQVNQTLEIRNSDNTRQNVHAMPKNDPDWNQSQVPSSEPLTHRFTHAEIAVPFKNNQHPWMKAYVGVFANPFFAVSDRNGAFTIEGLPPGNYTIAAWHADFGEKTLDVTIYPGSHQGFDFVFDIGERKVVH